MEEACPILLTATATDSKGGLWLRMNARLVDDTEAKTGEISG